MRAVCTAAVAVCGIAFTVCAHAYPERPIRLIVPYPPGGGVDAAGRIAARALSEQMNAKVVVENRAGATGTLGTQLVAKSEPDGYTLLFGSGAPNAVVPSVTPGLPYDPIGSFQPISLVGRTDYTLMVHPSLRVRNVPELIALARARPRELNYGSSGKLSNTHLAGELLNQMAKIEITHVPYKGTGPALVSLLTGETAISFGGGGAAAPHIESGRLRALATTGSTRRFPDVPTLAETLPGFEVLQWYGILAPAGTPKPVVERIYRELLRAATDPKVLKVFAANHTDAVTSRPDEFLAFIRSEIEKWGRVIRQAGIDIE